MLDKGEYRSMNNLVSRILLAVVGVTILYLVAACENIEPPKTNDTDASIDPVGVFTESSSTDAVILNPILWADDASAHAGRFFPSPLGVNPFTGEIEAREVAESWTVSDDGLTYTFSLHPDITWSDGHPVDAHDFKFTYDAIASDLVVTPRKSAVDNVSEIKVMDDQTVRIRFLEVQCDDLLNLGLGWLPSHLYAPDFGDVMTSPHNFAPPVSAGPFVFKEWVRNDHLVESRNENYWKGTPLKEGQVIRVIPDAGTRLAALAAGEVDLVHLEPSQVAWAEDREDIEVFKARDDGYVFIALNLADPGSPQPAFDATGQIIAQKPHPILGDPNVRRAIAHSLNYQDIIDKALMGHGYSMASNVLPAVAWAYDDALQPYAYDPELAMSLLEDAGWLDTDDDGTRECRGCTTAAEGTMLRLELLTNVGNSTRVALGAIAQDYLHAVGFSVALEGMEFGSVVDKLMGQTFDMVLAGWTSLGNDPNDEAFWHRRYDVPGSGFNFVSYSNPHIDRLLEQGNLVPGCGKETRAPIYKEIQQIIHEDIPYIFLTGNVKLVGYSKRWEGIDPGNWSFNHNEERWSLAE